MAVERFLVTGVMGCLGAWVAKTLIERGQSVVGLDLPGDGHRLAAILSDEQLAELEIVNADITDADAVDRHVGGAGITRMIHCAALQVPFVAADPRRGAEVNVVGTINLFESYRRHRDQVKGLVYASSAGVFGPASEYAGGVVEDDSPQAPTTLYGVYKQANEGSARVYARDFGLATVGLRPWIIYGPGRDQGLTSTITAAMAAAARGESYRFAFNGRSVLQFAPDVARIFVDASLATPTGAVTANIGGADVTLNEVRDVICGIVPEASLEIPTEELPVASCTGEPVLTDLVGEVRHTPLERGVADTIAFFRAGRDSRTYRRDGHDGQ